MGTSYLCFEILVVSRITFHIIISNINNAKNYFVTKNDYKCTIIQKLNFLVVNIERYMCINVTTMSIQNYEFFKEKKLAGQNVNTAFYRVDDIESNLDQI